MSPVRNLMGYLSGTLFTNKDLLKVNISYIKADF